MPHVRGPGGRPRGRDRRGAGRRRTATLNELQQAFTGAPRAPVRLLHARDAAHRPRVPAREPGRDRRARRSARRSAASSAAAPATSRSSRRSSPWRRSRDHRAASRRGPRSRPRRALKEAGRAAGSARASTASRTRASSAARAATSTTSACPAWPTRRSSAARTRHARIVAIDTSKAEALPGVVRVVTGADVTEHAAPLPSFGAGPIIQDLIAIEKVRHFGEAVAAVIAEDRYIAEDACDLIEVEYELLPAVIDPFDGAGRGRAARPREARDERRLRAHVHVRRGRPGVRRGAAQGAGEAALAALDRDADGHERRDRRLRPRHGRRDDPRQLDELHVLPLADRRVPEDPRDAS